MTYWHWLKLAARPAFTWPGDELALGIKPLSPTQLALMEKGGAIYSACATCHGQNGGGTAGLAPALAGSPWVLEAPERLQRIILQGFDGDYNGIMPPHGHMAELDDETLASLHRQARISTIGATTRIENAVLTDA